MPTRKGHPAPAHGQPPGPHPLTVAVAAISVVGMVILARRHRILIPTRTQRLRRTVARILDPDPLGAAIRSRRL